MTQSLKACESMQKLSEELNRLRVYCRKQIESRDEVIKSANEACERNCEIARGRIFAIEEQLRKYALENLPENKKSIKIGNVGVLKFQKQQPRITFSNGDNLKFDAPHFVDFAKKLNPDLVKTKNYSAVDWQKLKGKLEIGDGGEVFYKDTGEIINFLRAEILPDKFIVETVQK